jgi:hypothetical protein
MENVRDEHSRQPITGNNSSNSKYQGLYNITRPSSSWRFDVPRIPQ